MFLHKLFIMSIYAFALEQINFNIFTCLMYSCQKFNFCIMFL